MYLKKEPDIKTLFGKKVNILFKMDGKPKFKWYKWVVFNIDRSILEIQYDNDPNIYPYDLTCKVYKRHWKVFKEHISIPKFYEPPKTERKLVIADIPDSPRKQTHHNIHIEGGRTVIVKKRKFILL